MDINQIRELIDPFVQVFGTLIVSGASVSVLTQLLKLNWFPVAVSKFPRLTNAVLSAIASGVAIYTSGINVIFNGPVDYIGFAIGTVLLSAVTYHAVLKGTVPAKDGTSAQL